MKQVSVYVDNPMPSAKPVGHFPEGTRWCHLIADSEVELHDFVSKLGMKREWFQAGPGRIPHYDLTESTRTRAIEEGAIPLPRREFIQIGNRIRWTS